MTKEEALKLARRAILFAHDDGYKNEISQEAITAIREALAQPEFMLNGIDCSCGRKWRVVNNTLTASAQPEQNQFNPDWDAMAVMVEEQQRMAKRIAELEAQRKPLTDEEIEKIWWETKPYFDKHDFTRAIEAAHGIKE